jgi:hypothetical protein
VVVAWGGEMMVVVWPYCPEAVKSRVVSETVQINDGTKACLQLPGGGLWT